MFPLAMFPKSCQITTRTNTGPSLLSSLSVAHLLTFVSPNVRKYRWHSTQLVELLFMKQVVNMTDLAFESNRQIANQQGKLDNTKRRRRNFSSLFGSHPRQDKVHRIHTGVEVDDTLSRIPTVTARNIHADRSSIGCRPNTRITRILQCGTLPSVNNRTRMEVGAYLPPVPSCFLPVERLWGST